MRKSISKLIVAGLSLAVALTASAGAPFAMKNSKTKSSVTNVAATAKLPTATGKQFPGFKDLTLAGAQTKGTPIDGAKRLKRNPIASMLAPAYIAPACGPLYGISIYSESADEPYGFYELPSTSASNDLSLVLESDILASTYGACLGDGLYYVNILDTFWGFVFGAEHYIIDAENWDVVGYVEDDINAADIFTRFGTDITYDASTGNIYGCYYNEDGGSFFFGVQDPTTFATTKIAELDGILVGVAATKDGRIYGINLEGDLYQINKTTGDMTLIGNTGCAPQYLTSACIDDKSDVMYFTVCNPAGAYLAAINVNTAEAEMVYPFENGNEVVGLGILAPSAEPDAPGQVTDLTVTFEGDLRVGEVSFTMPTTTFAGDPMIGTMLYTVKRNGEVIKEGEAFNGFEVKFTDVVPATGKYTYVVTPSTLAGDGPKSKISLWVGPDAPVVPGNVAAVYEDGVVNVSWDAVDATLHSGYAPEDVTYRVSLYKDDVLVRFVDGITDTNVAFEYEAPENMTIFFATVQAVTPRTTSDLGVSNSFALGHLNTPFSETFSSPDSLAPYTIIDGNEDGRTWQFYEEGRIYISYNGSEPMDDWIITPPIRLEAGKEYTFSFIAGAASVSYPERIEALMGTAPTVEGMTTVLVDPVDLLGGQDEYGATFVAEETGDYYFGLHGISDEDELYIYVDNISVSAGVSVNAPDTPALSVTADKSGALQATIEYVVPTKNLNGEETNVSRVVVACDGKEINVNNAPAPGETYTITADVETDGIYTFTVTPYNAYGAGRVASETVYVGVNRPAAPQNVYMKETATLGEVAVTWEAPATDVNGYPINPELITYTVLTEEGIVAEGISETSCTYVATTGEQVFAYCAVYAETAAGYSEDPTISNMIPVGEPYAMPVIDSFDDGELTYGLGVTTPESSSATWGAYTDADIVGDFDGTNGLIAMSGSYVGDTSTLFTGKIALDSEAPYVAFAHYCIANDDENYLQIGVTDCATGENTLVKTIIMGEGVEGGWTPVMIPLTEFAGKNVYVTFTGVLATYGVIVIDQLKVYQPADYDLSVLNITAPALVAPGQEFNVTVEVMNVGVKDVPAYKVELLCNGENVATVDGEAVASSKTATVEIPQSLSAVASVSNIYTAKVVCEGDEVADNDLSPEYPVMVDIPNYPTATALAATKVEGGVALNWTAPDLSPENMPKKAVTEDFESYEPFTFEDFGDWTFFDEDGLGIGGANNVNIPGVVLGETLCAYFLMNTEGAGVDANETFNAHSGVQYLVSTFPYEGGQVADWVISPELSGDRQSISFYAKSFSSQYPETFRVLYSTSDPDITSFVEVATYASISSEWTEYSVMLPAGAKYFAIENISDDMFMLFIDDITYVPAGGEPLELTVVGYNIYRNGVKINESPVAETSYVDAEGSADDVYAVTVVYAEGESGASNTASVEGAPEPGTTGIDAVAGAATQIAVEGRTIIVKGATGRVNVYTADGKALYNAAAAERNSVNVVPGVYVVKAGNRVEKVIVK